MQPLDDVRAYFGDEVAFYFAFLGFYTKWLTYPGIVGIFFFVWQRYRGTDNTLLFIYCTWLSVWSLVFLLFWNRYESAIAFKWGVSELKGEVRDRRQYVPSEK